MYIISYISKAERELGALIKTAQREARELGNTDALKELRTLGQVYITHREVNLSIYYLKRLLFFLVNRKILQTLFFSRCP